MALIFDTGPLYASMDARDAAYRRSRTLIEAASEPRIVPSPVLVEVDYFVSRHLGANVMAAFLRDIQRGFYAVEDLLQDDYQRISELLVRYADADIGFVDAAVLAVVERLREPKLATLDQRHFSVLRPRHVDALQLLPEQ